MFVFALLAVADGCFAIDGIVNIIIELVYRVRI